MTNKIDVDKLGRIEALRVQSELLGGQFFRSKTMCSGVSLKPEPFMLLLGSVDLMGI